MALPPLNDFPPPHAVRDFRGSRLARRLLQSLGWRVNFEGLPALQGVLVVYPHTSNWDFVVMILAKWALGVQARFWGKDSLFRIPLFGTWLRWLGGIPVDRKAPQGIVAQVVARFDEHRSQSRPLWLGLAPEGTRKAIPGWRSGFYQTAVQAGVPLGLIRLDYGRRVVDVTHFIRLTGDAAHDMARIACVYEGVRGLHPLNAAPICLLDPSVPRKETTVS